MYFESPFRIDLDSNVATVGLEEYMLVAYAMIFAPEKNEVNRTRRS